MSEEQTISSTVEVDIVIDGGWVLSLDPERRIFQQGFVAIKDGVIVDVGRREDLAGRYHAKRVIDGRNKVTIPGLSNGHRHLLCCAKGAMPEGGTTLDALRRFIYPSFSRLTAEDMHVYALHATAEMVRFGTTSFEEPGCNHIEAVMTAVATSGMRCRIGPWTWDQNGSAGPSDLPDWLKFDAKEAIKRLEWGVETVRSFNNPRIRDAVTIEGVGTCSDELTVGAARLALEAESLMVIHKSTSEREVALELKAFGHRPIEHMHKIGALNERVLMNHVTSVAEWEVPLIADSGARISQNPSTALKLAKGTTQFGKWPELLAAGVPICLGTDAENCSNHQDITRAISLAALLPRDARQDPNAVSAEQALEMGTLGGSRVLGWDDIVGGIEVGKQADIVVYEADDFDWRPLHNPVANLVYGATGHSVHTVLVSGDILLDNKKLTRVDEGALREEVEKIDRRVLKEIGIEPRGTWPIY
ncbi:amidohydrolase family protein [Streptosporangium sp. NBC_01755]|uniref:amidohydrolase family protein n=1 Tax=unclassified Streptosporangium TaxID=2632669 RepID=UPI002DDBB365|nr:MULTISPECIES: amidohydrolase family protein [unclassified Streptosporangium]WSA26600.1 amidohydrolase family protein [Streptosporangium sp. NBC_01810]WSD01976.1 amidohydrolase family protein [Streptosporangium sp. NBC_01755]